MGFKTKKTTPKTTHDPVYTRLKIEILAKQGVVIPLKTCGTDLQKPGNKSYTCGVLVHFFCSLFSLNPFLL